MNVRPWMVLLSSAFAPLAHATQVLVGTTISSPSSLLIGSQSRLQNTGGVVTATFDNQSIAQAFTLSAAVVASDLAMWVGYTNTPATFTFRITDKIGPGTTGADVLYTGTGTFGSTAALLDINLGALALATGNYYLVLTSDTLTATPALNGSGCNGVPALGGINVCANTGFWGGAPSATSVSTAGSINGAYVAHNFTSGTAGTSPALTSFSPSAPIGQTMYFQLNGTVTAVPEPAPWALLAAAAGLLPVWRWRRPRRLANPA